LSSIIKIDRKRIPKVNETLLKIEHGSIEIWELDKIF